MPLRHHQNPLLLLLLLLLFTTTITATADQPPPILAYLFTLRRARHPLPQAWLHYFDGCAPGSYRIHIHVDPTFNATTAQDNSLAAKYFKQAHVLPRDQLAKVRRFGHELVRARMRLLRHALSNAADAASPPRFLSFFSESCAPIASCAAVHAHLAKEAQRDGGGGGSGSGSAAAGAAGPRSFIDNKRPIAKEQTAGGDEWNKAFAEVCPKCASLASPIAPSQFRYSPGWVTLWHQHASQLVQEEAVYDPAFATWGWNKMVNGIPDETYWSTLAYKLQHPITGDLMTYMEPGDAKTGHSKMFLEKDLPRVFSQPPPNFFARKFPTTPKMDRAILSYLQGGGGGPGGGGSGGGKGGGKGGGGGGGGGGGDKGEDLRQRRRTKQQ